MKTKFSHKIIAGFLASIIAFYSFKSTATFVGFIIYRTVIAETLCVQKDNPVDCYGKCELVKALKEDIKTELEFPAQNTEKLVVSLLYFQTIQRLHFELFNSIKKTLAVDGANYKTITVYYDIVTPPPLVA